ncbi:MAG: glycosyltransferase [Bacteroidia bacterium]|nr:glycosyltransferase [Bacteroidia bacterium]
MKDSLHTVHTGISGFPYASLAAINKQISINKGLISAGVDAIVLNRKGIFSPQNHPEISDHGNFEGVPYFTATESPYRPGSFMKRNMLKLKAIRNELKFFKKLHKEGRLDAIIIDSQYYSSIRYYRYLANRFKVPLIYHFVELRSKLDDEGRSFSLKTEARLIDKNVHKLFDGIMAISEVLENHVKKLDPNVPVLKIPALTDYYNFQVDKNLDVLPHFLYCGSAAYKEVIFFILDAFDKIRTPDEFEMHLVIRGTQEEKQRIYDYAASKKKADKIKFFSNLPYSELVQKYIDATGLLIPLRPTIQDAARFPHKVSEYLASHNPLITTHYGELKRYFVDGDNGLVASKYDIDEYASKMQWLVDHPEEAREIGERGYELGMQNFHFESMGVQMRDFILSLIGRQKPQDIEMDTV